MVSTPWVNYLMSAESDINSTPRLIFGNDQHTCIIDGIILSNKTIDENAINISLYFIREVNLVPVYFYLYNEIQLGKNETVDVLVNKTLFLEPGDIMYAVSNNVRHVFDTFVSYRVLNEL